MLSRLVGQVVVVEADATPQTTVTKYSVAAAIMVGMVMNTALSLE